MLRHLLAITHLNLGRFMPTNNGFRANPRIPCRPMVRARRRIASVNIALLFVGSIIVVVILGYLAMRLRPEARRQAHDYPVIRVYCAAGVAKPVESLISAYNHTYNSRVELVRAGGSGELAGQIKSEFEIGVDDGADMYITADVLLLDQAHSEGIVAERFALAEQMPVIAVAENSQVEIRNVRQLVSMDGIKFGVASKRAAVGKIIRDIADREGLLHELEAKKTTDSENVMALAQSLAMGGLDAAVIWDTTVNQLNQAHGSTVLKVAAPADNTGQAKSSIAIGILATTESPTACLRFARYLTAPQTGQSAFESFGFTFVPGDRWEEVPEIHLYCGSMFTPVLESAVREFAEREGVNIYTRWEGCGKLVASIKSTEDPNLFPDAYLACDRMFLEQVDEYFGQPVTISKNQIVLAVSHSTADRVKSPNDLWGQNLRIGICDPELSALGRLTEIMLSEPPYADLYPKIKGTAAVTVDVGPTLISQLLSGGLDVAFVYRSNIMADPRTLESVRIVELDPRAGRQHANQPWAISKSTGNPALMQRLFEWINRAETRSRFQEYGFQIN